MQKGRGPGEGIFALPYLILRRFRFPSIKKRELLMLLKHMMKFLTTMRMAHRLIVKIHRIFFKKSSNFAQKTQPDDRAYQLAVTKYLIGSNSILFSWII